MIKRNKILILRRIIQFCIITLFVGAYNFGWDILKGNFSTAEVLNSFYLSDPYFFFQMLASGFIPNKDVIIGVVIISLFYFLLRGRIFCSWVCPINIITDSASWLRRKLHIQSLISKEKISRNIRFYVLGLGLILSAIIGLAAFELINPISMLYRVLIYGSLSGLYVVILVFLLDLFILKHAWCGYICPVGAYYSLLGRYGILKVFHSQENCTHCMKCKHVCPEVEVLDIIGIKSGNINKGACTDCGRCIDVCDDNSLNFKITLKQK